MNALPDQLPCATELETLLQQIADDEPAPDPAHQRDCPYCQAALRQLQQGWTDVQALADQPVPIPPDLTAQIMARIRTLAGHITNSILLGSPHGDTRISHHALAQVIQRLAASVPGVVFASAKPQPQAPPHPRRINVAIRLVVAFQPTITKIADTVRQTLDRRIPPQTGAELDQINITISDITDEHT